MPAPMVPTPFNPCTCGHDYLRHTPNCLDCAGAHTFTTPGERLSNPANIANGASAAALTSRGG